MIIKIAKNEKTQVLKILLLLLLLPVMLAGCGSGKAGKSSMDGITSYKELNKAEYRIGVLNGNIAGPLVEKHLPDLSQKVHKRL